MEISVNQVEFLRECDRAFGFLVEEFDFHKELSTAEPGLTRVDYVKDGVAVECVLEARDLDVSVKIVRCSHGQLPTAFRIDETGVLVREYLTQLLLRRGIRDIGFPRLDHTPRVLSFQQRCRRALEGYAAMLRKHARDVLEGSSSILDAEA